MNQIEAQNTHHVASVQGCAELIASEASDFASGVAVANVGGNSGGDGCHVVKTQVGHAVGELGKEGERLADATGGADDGDLVLGHCTPVEGARKHGAGHLGGCCEKKQGRGGKKEDS